MADTIEELRSALRSFVAARDWQRFHSPKNLAMALSVEVAELVEIFQWRSEPESRELPDDQLREVGDEIGDILIYLVRLADELDLDPIAAAWRKLPRNEERYPAERVRGSAKKYDEY